MNSRAQEGTQLPVAGLKASSSALGRLCSPLLGKVCWLLNLSWFKSQVILKKRVIDEKVIAHWRMVPVIIPEMIISGRANVPGVIASERVIIHRMITSGKARAPPRPSSIIIFYLLSNAQKLASKEIHNHLPPHLF